MENFGCFLVGKCRVDFGFGEYNKIVVCTRARLGAPVFEKDYNFSVSKGDSVSRFWIVLYDVTAVYRWIHCPSCICAILECSEDDEWGFAIAGNFGSDRVFAHGFF